MLYFSAPSNHHRHYILGITESKYTKGLEITMILTVCLSFPPSRSRVLIFGSIKLEERAFRRLLICRFLDSRMTSSDWWNIVISGKNCRNILFWGDKLYFSALKYTSTTIYFSSQVSQDLPCKLLVKKKVLDEMEALSVHILPSFGWRRYFKIQVVTFTLLSTRSLLILSCDNITSPTRNHVFLMVFCN